MYCNKMLHQRPLVTRIVRRTFQKHITKYVIATQSLQTSNEPETWDLCLAFLNMAFVCLISRVNVAAIDVLQHLRDAGHRNNTLKGVKLHLFIGVKLYTYLEKA